MAECVIGPVEISESHLYDEDSFAVSSSAAKFITSSSSIFSRGSYSEEESFSLICTYAEALSLKGIVEIGEAVWINTSTYYIDNLNFQHKGWYLITNIDFTNQNMGLVQVDMQVEKVSSYYDEYITLDYSKGIYDGISLDYTYQPSSVTYQIQDDMSTINNWNSVQKYQDGGASCTATGVSDGSEIDITVTPSIDGRCAVGWMRSKAKFYPPFTLETVLDRNSLPSAGSYAASIALGFSKEVLPESQDAINKTGAIQWSYYEWLMSNTEAYHQVATSRSGSWSTLYPWNSTNLTAAEMGLKIVMDAKGNMEVYVDHGLTSTWTRIFNGWSMIDSVEKGLYMYLYVSNRDTNAWTGSFQKLDIYNTSANDPDNVVCLPYNATGITTPTGTRSGELGNTSYYLNPTTELRYTIPETNLYDSIVQLLSTNNPTVTSTQVFGTDYKLTPTTTVLKNQFTKLVFKSNGFELYGYDSGAWQLINTFVYPSNISLIKPLLITYDDIWLQVNNTKIHMTRSSPMISLYHPNTAVTYTVKDRFWYNGALDTTISPGDSIAMTNLTNGYYAYTYNNATPTYRTVFGKKDPTSIYSDSIPADDITSIGWNTSTQEGVSNGVNTTVKLVEQWWKQTRTRNSLKQIV